MAPIFIFTAKQRRRFPHHRLRRLVHHARRTNARHRYFNPKPFARARRPRTHGHDDVIRFNFFHRSIVLIFIHQSAHFRAIIRERHPSDFALDARGAESHGGVVQFFAQFLRCHLRRAEFVHHSTHLNVTVEPRHEGSRSTVQRRSAQHAQRRDFSIRLQQQLLRERLVQLKRALMQRRGRRAVSPVPGEETSALTARRARHARSLDDDDVAVGGALTKIRARASPKAASGDRDDGFVASDARVDRAVGLGARNHGGRAVMDGAHRD